MYHLFGYYAARGAGGDQQVHAGSHTHIRLVHEHSILFLYTIQYTTNNSYTHSYTYVCLVL